MNRKAISKLPNNSTIVSNLYDNVVTAADCCMLIFTQTITIMMMIVGCFFIIIIAYITI